MALAAQRDGDRITVVSDTKHVDSDKVGRKAAEVMVLGESAVYVSKVHVDGYEAAWQYRVE